MRNPLIKLNHLHRRYLCFGIYSIYVMKLEFDIKRYRLDFKFDARTSRGAVRNKESLFIIIRDQGNPGQFGIGECGPLPGLSPEHVNDAHKVLHQLSQECRLEDVRSMNEVMPWVSRNIDRSMPSLRFGMEVALRDFFQGGRRCIFDNAFFQGKKRIQINGLIWMGNKEFMIRQIRHKLDAGFACIKIKVGALAHDVELEVLKYIRSEFGRQDVEIRLDANGAFTAEEAMHYLERFAEYGIHSIEQPIGAGQAESMFALCRKSPIPVALDEDLIGVDPLAAGKKFLSDIKPHFIILKPSLMGGIAAARAWIDLASSMDIGWWMTSALESDIGLNAIAQLASEYDPQIPQGLGTGQLYFNNFSSPLRLDSDVLSYDKKSTWQLDPLFR